MKFFSANLRHWVRRMLGIILLGSINLSFGRLLVNLFTKSNYANVPDQAPQLTIQNYIIWASSYSSSKSTSHNLSPHLFPTHCSRPVCHRDQS